MVKIVSASESDIPVIVDIAEKSWWQTYSGILTRDQIRYMLDVIYASETLRAQMEAGLQRYLLLTADGQGQGFASFGPRPENEMVFKIHKLYVLPQNQKSGYGQALVEHIKQKVGAENVRTVDLNVNRFNPARHFYEKMGFRIIREEDVPIGPYWMNDFVMRLEF